MTSEYLFFKQTSFCLDFSSPTVGFSLVNLDCLVKFNLVEFGFGQAYGLVKSILFAFSLVKTDVTNNLKIKKFLCKTS